MSPSRVCLRAKKLQLKPPSDFGILSALLNHALLRFRAVGRGSYDERAGFSDVAPNFYPA